ncbi:LamG-like jellyroll fold domain-containing protein [Kiritimatiella glycovorans]|nr:LamG-like jellyroll fold domain-containing protein [Kiritimatiella glycovorans]
MMIVAGMNVSISGLWAEVVDYTIPSMDREPEKIAPAVVLEDAVFRLNCAGENAAATSPAIADASGVEMGVSLTEDATVRARARGGAGTALDLAEGSIRVAPSADVNREHETFSLYVRLRDPEGKWDYPILGSYGSDEKVSFFLHAVDGRKKPQENINSGGARLPSIAAMLFSEEDGVDYIDGHKSMIEFVIGLPRAPEYYLNRQTNAKKKAGVETDHLLEDARNGVMRVTFPVAWMGPKDWHDIVVRFTGPKLELFVDGVLVDVEYPIGKMRPSEAPFLIGAAAVGEEVVKGFDGQLSHLAVWDRSLSDDEILALCGGKSHVVQRAEEMLGPVRTERLQYFRPRGHNLKPGDCMPYYHDGTWHLLYLVLRGNMARKWDSGHGGLELHHASSRDLVHWQHHPIMIPISEQWMRWVGTGDTAIHDGEIFFYNHLPSWDPDRKFGGLQCFRSDDGITFTKHDQSPYPEVPGWPGAPDIYEYPDGRYCMTYDADLLRGKPLPTLRDKTLVAWVTLADLDQRGGGLVTVEHEGQFDSLVFGEVRSRRWMAGSDRLLRTARDQAGWPEEAVNPHELVQMAAVYRGNQVVLYRNGRPYAQHEVNEPAAFSRYAISIGTRVSDGPANSYFRGSIEDARVYASALSREQIAALKPNEPSAETPLAWWDFEQENPTDRVGTFASSFLAGDARVADGRLHLSGDESFLLASSDARQVRGLVSDDLMNWTPLDEPVAVIPSRFRLTCSQIFRWGDWHYMLAGNNVWQSREFTGPWQPADTFILDALKIPKAAPFRDGRMIAAGMMTHRGWGGDIVFRELLQEEDGTLGARFVPEMIPRTGEELPLVTASDSAGAIAGDTVTANGANGFHAIPLTGIPRDVRITFQAVPDENTTGFGVGLRSSPDNSRGLELRVEPARATVGLFAVDGNRENANAAEDQRHRLGKLDAALTIDIVCRRDIVDVEIGGRRTLIQRYWNPGSDRIYLFAEGGDVRFEGVRVRPLVE